MRASSNHLTTNITTGRLTRASQFESTRSTALPTFHPTDPKHDMVTRSPHQPRKRLTSHLDETTMNSSSFINNNSSFSNSSSSFAMDTNSLCSSDFTASDMSGMSNDTFEITRRGRQDAMMDSRLGGYSSRYGRPDLSLPDPRRWSSGSSMGGRRVSFAGQKIINEGAYEVITEEEMEIRWWSQEDLDNIKKAAKEMSLKLRKLAKEKGCYVETAHKKTSLMLTNSFQELVKMSASSPDQDLRHWCVRSDGRRGLERFACREYGNTRKDDVISTRMAVFAEQDRQRKNNTYVPENIAKVSKAHSRRSRTFSLFMGEADAQSTRSVTRTSSTKRVKGSHSSHQPKQKQQRRVQSTSRGFAVEAPVLTSSA